MLNRLTSNQKLSLYLQSLSLHSDFRICTLSCRDLGRHMPIIPNECSDYGRVSREAGVNP